jgi:cytochrome c oxidase cbb3-type subunit 2
MYDHPFQWGSKRNGPDLARVGGKYSNDWHYAHLQQPSALVPETIMPAYAFLAAYPLKYDDIAEHLKANRMVGVPYTDDMIQNARVDLETQAHPDSDQGELTKRYAKTTVVGETGAKPVTELDALVAYLQVLGTMVNFADATQEDLQQ